MRLYEMMDTYTDLMEMYEEAETDAQREEILAEIAGVEVDISEKGENYARLIKNTEADSTALDAEIKRLTAKKKAADNLVRRLKENLLFAMENARATEIKTPLGRWYIQKNPLSVKVVDPAKVPARFLIEKEPDIDRRAILAEFKDSGELFDGIEITQGQGVRFR